MLVYSVCVTIVGSSGLAGPGPPGPVFPPGPVPPGGTTEPDGTHDIAGGVLVQELASTSSALFNITNPFLGQAILHDIYW